MNIKSKISILIIMIFLAIVFLYSKNKLNNSNINLNQVKVEKVTEVSNKITKIVLPIDRAGERITKKFFGTYVTPKNSPVSPEKFTGYHTGLDFETFASEKDADVSVKAICDGPILQKKIATGYGGVVVEKCTINNEIVTVVYGHMRLSSIKAVVGEELKAGEEFALLGTGFSTETDGERKHLHLDIHKGSEINIKGYVQSKSELGDWVDPKVLLDL